ncbi:ER lumen protein retaining receptor-domain-containing protein [Apiosordaria backusii]|uniref:ER lumen protein retaining receptor-domain-containing protein n=1 Tax=Apiosordaria backusii TaxID=314023 RepID=A0AA40EYV9_9PEZI|nr:ER lumen protein retaining receptor-domain-containing protein [Apiosordaria backusii]
MAWNIFRIAADLSHITAKCILIFSIHRNRSAEGVSLLTQLFYAVVFVTRYTDLFSETHAWNYFFKVFYLLSSFYTLGIMRFVYPRTREKEAAWKLAALVFFGSLILSPFIMLIFDKKEEWAFTEWLWVFSQILESVCVLPQLLLLRQTTVPTVITSFYIVFLGSYRGLYLLNWFLRGLDTNGRKPNPISVIFGIVQTALYADFAWVYWTRQRVKLRNGGVVDADDLRRGWLLSKIFGSKHLRSSTNGGAGTGDDDDDEYDEESAPALGGGHQVGRDSRPGRAKWGSRGISISADEGVYDDGEGGSARQEQGVVSNNSRRGGFADESDDDDLAGGADPDAKMQDPDDLARALNDDEDDDSDEEEDNKKKKKKQTQGSAAANGGQPSGIRSGDEWDDD